MEQNFGKSRGQVLKYNNMIFQNLTLPISFISFLIFIILFKKPLESLIKRTTSINKDGLIADRPTDSQSEPSNSDAEAIRKLLDSVGNSEVITEQEERIRNDLIERGLSPEGDTAQVLIRHLAGSQLLLAFERIHNSIFGSQIFMLKRLNEAAGRGRHIDDILSHIDQVKNEFNEQLGNCDYENYLHYLFSNFLIVRHDDTMHITKLGNEYLTWIARNWRSENNPL